MALTRDEIVNAKDTNLQARPIHVPEWVNAAGDDVVYIRGLTGKERDEYVDGLTRMQPNGKGEMVTVPNNDNAGARMAARGIVDEEGKRLFRDDEAHVLGELSAQGLDRVIEAISGISGIGAVAEGAAEGNFVAAQSGATGSNSPNGSAAP